MAITGYSQSRIGGETLVSVTSDLSGLVYFHWYIDGGYQGPTTSDDGHSSRSFLLQDGQQNRVEVLDTTDPDFDPIANEPASYPASRTLAFIRSMGANIDSYRVEQQISGGAFVPLFSIPDDVKTWEYRVLVSGLADLTMYSWQVVAVDAFGNDGGPISLSLDETIVRWPDAPDFSVSFNPATSKVTFGAP